MIDRSLFLRILVPSLLVTAASVATSMHAAEREDELAQLAWLSGCWQGKGGEECWMAPRGGLMVGVNRMVGEDGKASFEFLRIVKGEEGLVFLASPGGRSPATPFAAIEVTDSRVVFANPEHDFPQRITYWREGEDTLRARVEAEQEGELRGFELVWTRSSWRGD